MAVWIPVLCPHCHSSDVIKNGFSTAGIQRYRCQNPQCPAASFSLDHSYPGRTKEVQQEIVEMALNGSGVRDTARVLGVSTTTVTKVLKKRIHLQQVNKKLLQDIDTGNVHVDVVCVDQQATQDRIEAEMDEMWSFVQAKRNQRCQWHAIDRETGKVLAYVFGRRQDLVFLRLQILLEPFGIKHFYADD